MGISLTGFSMPIFWWGLLLIILFSGILQWTPVSGRISLIYFVEAKTGFMLIDSLLSDEKGAFRSALSHLILPAIVLGTVPLAVIARQTRSAMLEVLGEDYVRTARAKGLPPSRVIGLHALRNALIPVVTVIGLLVGTLFGGAILTETIFAWPGVGKWLVDSISRRDYPSVQGGVVLIASIVMLVNLGVDLLYGADQPPHPARELSHGRTRRSSPLPSPLPVSLPPSPLAEFWHYFRENNGAVAGLAVIVAGGPRRDLRRRHRPARPDPAEPRRVPPAARLAGGRLLVLPARHRRGRPRHPLAHHLRRPLLAPDRRHRHHALAHRRRGPGPGRRLRPRLGRDPDHAAHGHHPGPAQPAARDRHRGDPGARPASTP